MNRDFDDNNETDDGFIDERPPHNHNRRHQYERPRWRVLDTKVRGENAAVEVSILDLEVPRFSFRVGTAHFPKYDGDPITVSPRLTIFNVEDAAELLTELAAKYLKVREDKIDELEKRKAQALRRKAAEPEVEIVRRPKVDDE